MYNNMQVNQVNISALVGKVYLVCLLLFMATGTKANASDIDLWNKANALYARKNFDSAAIIYQSLLNSNTENATLHYNAGNAYYRLNKIGYAIFHYEKAAHLEPGNKNIDDNLALAKAKVADNMEQGSPIFFVAWWNALKHTVGMNGWAVLTILTFLVLLALIYFSRVKKDDFANAGRWIALSVVCFMLCGIMSWVAYDEHAHPDTAVVLTTNAVFLQTPQASGKVIGSLPEGLVIELLEKQTSYYKVALQNGKTGWIAVENLGVI